MRQPTRFPSSTRSFGQGIHPTPNLRPRVGNLSSIRYTEKRQRLIFEQLEHAPIWRWPAEWRQVPQPGRTQRGQGLALNGGHQSAQAFDRLTQALVQRRSGSTRRLPWRRFGRAARLDCGSWPDVEQYNGTDNRVGHELSQAPGELGADLGLGRLARSTGRKRPKPQRLSGRSVAPPGWTAVCLKAWMISATGASGRTAMSSAAQPATWGVAIEVPTP